MPSIASVLFSTQHEFTASELRSSVEPTQPQSTLPSRPQYGTQMTSSSITTSWMPDPSSFATSVFTTPTAMTYTSVMTTRKFSNDSDNPLSGHNATDADPANQARHTFIPVPVILAIASIIIGISVALVRYKSQRRQVIKHAHL